MKTELRNEILTRRCERYREIINEYRMAAGDGFNDLTDKYNNQISTNDLRFLLYMEEITDSLGLPTRDLKDKINERISRNAYFMEYVVTNNIVRKELQANTDILKTLMEIIYDEDELAEPVIGDVVEYTVPMANVTDRAVFISSGSRGCILMQRCGTILSLDIEKDHYTLKKTGEYVDILGMLEKVGLK